MKMMSKTNKGKGVIYIYEILITGGIVKKQEIAEKFEVSHKTITRYINELNEYFAEENRREMIKYDRKKGGYLLISQEENCFNKKDILAIAKVLLESRGFSKKEMTNLLEKLVSSCHYEDKTYIKKVIANEMENYVQPRHGNDVIDLIWEISGAIREQRIIDLEYTKLGKDGKVQERGSNWKVKPQAILFSEYYFYLCAYIQGKSYESPTIFRLDRIKSFETLKEGFRVDYKSRFKEGEFRKLIQFMYSGKLQKIKFKFKGESIEAVLDRLPTAEVISEGEDGFIVEAKIFGRGIKMWILSQGEYIEVLEPKDFRGEIKECIIKMQSVYETK